VVIYIVGVFCVGAAEMLLAPFNAFRGPDPRDILAISRTGGPIVQQLYGDYIRNYELLKGAAVSFLLLAVGSLAESWNAPGYAGLIWLAATAGCALSMLSLLFSRRAVAQATSLARALHRVDA
jgi:hypothetical protein